MSSIVVRIRFSDSELSYGITGLNKTGQIPTKLNEIVRQVYTAGLMALNGFDYNSHYPEKTSLEYLDKLTTQNKAKQNQVALKNTLQNILITNPVTIPKFTSNLSYEYLLQYLSIDDQEAGQNLLANLDSGNSTIELNLKAENSRIRELTYTMFAPIKAELSKKEYEALEKYKKLLNRSE